MARTASTGKASATITDLERFRQSIARGTSVHQAYVILLGLNALDAPDLLRAVKKGLPFRAFERLRDTIGLPSERLAELIDVPRRTMSRRRREGRFPPGESDRLLRASRILGRALDLFEGDRDAAVEWLTNQQPALGGGIPLELASQEVGALEVERLIDRLEHGVFP
jgi:putative toxin-antitoxin system antitoxin component (TIGR02293 family)